jgi:hypothetical protein
MRLHYMPFIYEDLREMLDFGSNNLWGVLDWSWSSEDSPWGNWESVAGNSVSIVVSDVVGGQDSTVWGNVRERSSDTTSSISNGSVGLSRLRVSERSLTELILSVVLGLGDGWGNGNWSSSVSESGVSESMRVSESRISESSNVNLWGSTSCGQDGSENSLYTNENDVIEGVTKNRSSVIKEIPITLSESNSDNHYYPTYESLHDDEFEVWSCLLHLSELLNWK